MEPPATVVAMVLQADHPTVATVDMASSALTAPMVSPPPLKGTDRDNHMDTSQTVTTANLTLPLPLIRTSTSAIQTTQSISPLRVLEKLSRQETRSRLTTTALFLMELSSIQATKEAHHLISLSEKARLSNAGTKRSRDSQ